MKKFLLFFMAFFAVAFSQEWSSYIMAPGCGYPLTYYDEIDSLFNTADSSFRTIDSYGQRAICVGLQSNGNDTGDIVVLLAFNADTTIRYKLHIASDMVKQRIPIPFVKIFESGTTISLDSLDIFLDVQKQAPDWYKR